jgi:hypothetical protein
MNSRSAAGCGSPRGSCPGFQNGLAGTAGARSKRKRGLPRYGHTVAIIRIEPEPPIKTNPCDSCEGTNRLLHGYVYEDEEPRGIYFVEWCDGAHPQRAAFLTVGLGNFEGEASTTDRNAFCIEWRAEGMGLTEEPARDRPELLGRFVPRELALARTDIDRVWHVCDHIVADDPRLSTVDQWLETGGGHASSPANRLG